MSESAASQTPVLFVHGAWHQADCWTDMAAEFEPHFANIRLVRLSGHSPDGNTAWKRIADYVNDIHEVAKEFTEPPILIGHSMGGFTAQAYMSKYPTAAVILLASMPPTGNMSLFLNNFNYFGLFFLPRALYTQLFGYLTAPSARLWFYPRSSEEYSDEKVAEATKQLVNESSMIAFDFVFGIPQRMSEATVPIMVIGADADMIVTEHAVAETAKFYRTTPKIYKGPHNLMAMPIYREIAADMIEWLKSAGGTPAKE